MPKPNTSSPEVQERAIRMGLGRDVAATAVVMLTALPYRFQLGTVDPGGALTNVPGATAANYTTPATALVDSGTQYRVTVSSGSNSLTSSAATLTVTVAPVAAAITVHPGNQTIIENQDASFSVTATGTSLSHQWQRSTDGGTNFADLSGETNATLSLAAVALADNGQQFHAVVSNILGSVTSNNATLTVNPTPVVPAFTAQPADQSVTAPATASFGGRRRAYAHAAMAVEHQ